ncbi:sodium:solute symporter family protein [Saccharomonospora glauca]|uniref:Na+/proline symporter n=1 Tax=Saccharomonospora glauca K62 TaxID=928724 RepID=I1D5P9_9PSEU|nr:sodium:solute symporter family protein [Saccharomonospora glauca]EIF00274.1 Na+/proline symporter [Saccharomonospora glauca K62]
MFQLSATTTVLLLVGFYGLTYLMTRTIKEKKENVDGFMVSNNAVGFGISAASMTATWVWAASFYASATSGYSYGLSGPVHYGLWGALMILCIYPFGRRFRELAPRAHTLAEMMRARHGKSSQLILAFSNIAGSVISLTANFTAAGALVEVLTPFDFMHGVLAVAIGVLAYTLWSGFRASVLTDYAQLVAMMLAAALIIPMVFFAAGGTDVIDEGMLKITDEQADFFSGTAFLEQGAPYLAAVLAYAVGNQTIAQRLFAVRKDKIKATFVTATLGYAGTVIGLGMIGLVALMVGLQPMNGDMNNIIPQMASEYLPAVMIALLFIMVIGSLSSTADSDLAALSSLVMTDIYGRNLARNKAKPETMLLIGRLTMVGATALGVMIAMTKFDILDLLVFMGGLWGALVFPVIVSCFWDRINNLAFTASAIAGVVFFVVARFELLELTGVVGLVMEIAAVIGAAVVFGLMAFGFFGKNVGLGVGGVSLVALAPFVIGFLRDYPTLLGALVAYGASTVACVLVTMRNTERFDFALLNERVTAFQDEEKQNTEPGDDAVAAR